MSPEPAPQTTRWSSARDARADKGHGTRTQLLKAAAAVFAKHGYARTTAALIAEAAGVSRPSFYVYFASKEAAFLEVARQVRDDFLAAHDTSGIDETDIIALGYAASPRFLHAFTAHADLLTVIEHQAIADPQVAEVWSEIQQRPIRRIARFVRRISTSGEGVPAASPETIGLVTMGLFERAGRTAPQGSKAYAALSEELTAVWFRLIGVDPNKPTAGD